MDISIETPALLFPAISLLFLSYTNRFLATGQLIRSLGSNVKNGKSIEIKKQILNLKNRMNLIKWMQIFGAIALLLCTISMSLLFFKFNIFGAYTFFSSLITMFISLSLLIKELYISTIALNIELENMDKD